MAARRLRPISLWISRVRPPCLPFAASRALRVAVARGSIEYSAVTQPTPRPSRKGGTRASTDAEVSTRVSPRSIWAEPSANFMAPRVMASGRRASSERPPGRGFLWLIGTESISEGDAMSLSLADLRQRPNALARFYTRFRVADRLLLTGHSHQAWPDRAEA